ncbi:hypothetical protein AB0D27_41395 [Streptomyces sp. NPDC048415]|uniref:hypothetical protein n=1 Tax=Streptomyces sp. NPDC048415 TaxID=3154822 RepID=UPI00341850BA
MPRTTTAPAESTPAGRRTGSQTAADLAFLARAMKAPALLDAADRLESAVARYDTERRPRSQSVARPAGQAGRLGWL